MRLNKRDAFGVCLVFYFGWIYFIFFVDSSANRIINEMIAGFYVGLLISKLHIYLVYGPKSPDEQLLYEMHSFNKLVLEKYQELIEVNHEMHEKIKQLEGKDENVG